MFCTKILHAVEKTYLNTGSASDLTDSKLMHVYQYLELILQNKLLFIYI